MDPIVLLIFKCLGWWLLSGAVGSALVVIGLRIYPNDHDSGCGEEQLPLKWALLAILAGPMCLFQSVALFLVALTKRLYRWRHAVAAEPPIADKYLCIDSFLENVHYEPMKPEEPVVEKVETERDYRFLDI